MFTTTKENLAHHLSHELGLNKNDLVFLHSGITVLGRIEGGIHTITDAFDEVLSDGILVIPTFTYSWCKSDVYNPLSSECPDMGSYAKEAWKTPDFIRSNNPNFSVASLRNSKNYSIIEYMFSFPSAYTCFGKGSVFDRMYELSSEKDGYILLLGGAHNDVVFRCTFLHYVEELLSVPYRYVKRFRNPENPSEYVEQLVRFVSLKEYRHMRGDAECFYSFPIEAKYHQLGEDLIQSGLIKMVPFGYSKSRMVHIRHFCDWLKRKIKEDQNYLLK